ncbi:RDD family protein [Wolbachia endosymbiont of Ostrinia furnacalis]|nr:RDD family protein [Wolbachia endosymbiont of Ostrinia furnacalis]
MFFKKVNIQDFYDAKGTHVFYINVNISHALNQQQFYYYLSTNIITLDNGVGYTQMGVRMNYAKVTKRIAAYLVDQTIFLVCCSFFFLLISFILPEESLTNFFNYVFPDTDIDTELISKRYEILEDLGTLLASLVYIALEVLMIIRLGWTPGKLLFGIYIKDANTLKNIAFMQVVIRSTFKTFLFVFLDTYEWFLISPVLVLMLIPIIFDQRKQLFYDKIAKTVVMDYRSEECYPRLNCVYVEITRRAVATCVIHRGYYSKNVR